MKELISVEEALDIVLASAHRLASEHVKLSESLRRVVAAPVTARSPIPPFDNSAMDGYAVRHEDVVELPAELDIIGEVAAGSWPDQSVGPGVCVRIMTGAPMAPGADCIVPIEWTDGASSGRVRISRTPPPGFAVRHAGDDVKPGQRIVGDGDIITPPVVGLLASVGIGDVAVARRPRVSILTTGNEIVHHESEPRLGQIRNSNGPALSAQAEAAGAVVAGADSAADDLAVLEERIRSGLQADILVLSGGVSVGAYDLVQDVLRRLDVNLKFWKVRQRPGKPLLFGTREQTLVFGLPGNPVSASICFDRYVRPTIHKMSGRGATDRTRLRGILIQPMSKVRGLYYFARGVYDRSGDVLEVRPSGSQSSAVYSALVDANCLIHLPEEMEDPQAGTQVWVEPLTW